MAFPGNGLSMELPSSLRGRTSLRVQDGRLVEVGPNVTGFRFILVASDSRICDWIEDPCVWLEVEGNGMRVDDTAVSGR